MCLLSYARVNEEAVFTSNRDISTLRPPAKKIKSYIHNHNKVNCPEDHKGGTLLIHDINSVMILLNGAEVNHISRDSYRRRKGLILIDLFKIEIWLTSWKVLNLSDREPFTIIYFHRNNIFVQLTWDGMQKSMVQLDQHMHQIWLSSTLYTSEEKLNCTNSFASAPKETLEEILVFNKKNTYESIKTKNLRKPIVMTTSHYQVVFEKENIFVTELLRV